METSDLQQQQQQQLGQQGAGGAKKQNSPSSSPEVAEAGFVMVPPSLAGDSSKHKNNQGLGVSPLTARRIGARPGSLPGVSRAHSTEPIPVPTQRAAYAAIQNSLVASRTQQKEEEKQSVSAMSGVSSAS